MRFIITDRITCWIDFKYEVEAETEEEAKRLYQNDEYVEVGHEICENVEGVENIISIEKLLE